MYVPFTLISPVTSAWGRLGGKETQFVSCARAPFLFSCPVHPSCHPIFMSSREEGTGARPLPYSPLLLKHCTFRVCGATEWSRPIEPSCSSPHECVRLEWIELDFESPRPSAPTPSPPPPPPPHPPSPSIAGGATGSGAERGLWFLSQWAQCIFKLGPFVCVAARPESDLHAENTNQTFDRSS